MYHNKTEKKDYLQTSHIFYCAVESLLNSKLNDLICSILCFVTTGSGFLPDRAVCSVKSQDITSYRSLKPQILLCKTLATRLSKYQSFHIRSQLHTLFTAELSLCAVTTSWDLNATHNSPKPKNARTFTSEWWVSSGTLAPLATRKEILSHVRCGNLVWSVRPSCSLLWDNFEGKISCTEVVFCCALSVSCSVMVVLFHPHN